MYNKNSLTSLLAGHLGSHYLKENGKLILTGSQYTFNNATPDMLSYSLSKSIVHSLSISLSKDKTYVNK